MARQIHVTPAGVGWAVRFDGFEDLLFKTGARAEAAARALAGRLAAAGRAAELHIFLRDGSLAARVLYPTPAIPHPVAG